MLYMLKNMLTDEKLDSDRLSNIHDSEIKPLTDEHIDLKDGFASFANHYHNTGRFSYVYANVLNNILSGGSIIRNGERIQYKPY